MELRTGEQSEILVLGILEDAGGYWKLERAGEYQVTEKLLGIWGIEGGIPRVRGISGIPGVTLEVRGVPDTRGCGGGQGCAHIRPGRISFLSPLPPHPGVAPPQRALAASCG